MFLPFPLGETQGPIFVVWSICLHDDDDDDDDDSSMTVRINGPRRQGQCCVGLSTHPAWCVHTLWKEFNRAFLNK